MTKDSNDLVQDQPTTTPLLEASLSPQGVDVHPLESPAPNPSTSPHLTIVEQISYIPPNDQPISIESKFYARIISNEQPYIRKCVAKSEPKPIDYGWIDKPSWIVIVNNEGRFTQVQPTIQEREESAKRVLYLWTGMMMAFCSLLPGESLRIRLCSQSKLLVSGPLHHEVRYTVHVFPQ